MSASHMVRKGFTLVEILIVVVILGILAAIVIPQFTSASESAKASSLVTQLQTLRSQLELYQLQHNGEYPPDDDSDDFWEQLTEKTYADGTIAPATPLEATFGPYIQKEISNPFSGKNEIVAGTVTAGVLAGTADEDTGWVYNQTTGKIAGAMELEKAKAVNLEPGTAAAPKGGFGDVITYTASN